MAPGMHGSQLLPKSGLGGTGHCSAGLVFLLPCMFTWGGFGGKPRCTMLSRTGTNPCSRGGGGRAVIQTAPSSALMTFTCTDSIGSWGVLWSPRVWGKPYHREGAAVKGPPPPLGQAGSALWQWICHHGNRICRPGPPRRQLDPCSIRRLPFIFNRAQQHGVALSPGGSRAAASTQLPWLGGTIHTSLQLQSTGSSHRENKHGWMSKSEFNPHCFHRLIPFSHHF